MVDMSMHDLTNGTGSDKKKRDKTNKPGTLDTLWPSAQCLPDEIQLMFVNANFEIAIKLCKASKPSEKQKSRPKNEKTWLTTTSQVN